MNSEKEKKIYGMEIYELDNKEEQKKPSHQEEHKENEEKPHGTVVWSCRITPEIYIFIREHDKFRELFDDQRTFREKFIEWALKLMAQLQPQIEDAHEKLKTLSPVSEKKPTNNKPG
jgi:hypothetical protein